MEKAITTVPYPYRFIELAAFDLVGFTKIVQSGGEMYREVRADGRWEALKHMAASDGCIYGVASTDKKCPPDHYRYTLAVRSGPDKNADPRHEGDLFPFRVKQSRWAAFTIEHFARQYGGFWQSDPYKMIQELGLSYNRALSIHIDVYSQAYLTDDDKMEFWMPIGSAHGQTGDQDPT